MSPVPVVRLLSGSAGETRALARAVAPLVRRGDLLLLGGELGSGKTVFAQGFGEGLGVTGPITSPTFTLVRTYEAELPLIHADIYRLDRLQEVIDLGLSELMDDSAVALVEWGDVAAATFSADYLSVRIDFDLEVDERRWLELHPVGPSWAARAPGLARALQRWAVFSAADRDEGGPG